MRVLGTLYYAGTNCKFLWALERFKTKYECVTTSSNFREIQAAGICKSSIFMKAFGVKYGGLMTMAHGNHSSRFPSRIGLMHDDSTPSISRDNGPFPFAVVPFETLSCRSNSQDCSSS